jgi:glycosyltransferase involved in cell wall biosynthesis
MIVASHPTGNAFVRALLRELEKEKRLARFFTTIVDGRRRTFPIPADRIETCPARELVRLALQRFRTRLTRHEMGWASVDGVYRELDLRVAQWLNTEARDIDWAYGYEDGALETFRAARKLGIRCAYELPIAYWETSRRLLREEAERYPEWEPTLGATRDSDEKMARKTEELELADKIICPSPFVLESIPAHARERSVVALFGSPRAGRVRQAHGGPLRVLFAGAMTQRKGLADLFGAMKLLRRYDVQLHVMGAPLAPMDFYRSQYDGFTHKGPRSRSMMLALMATCDVLVLPSIVEGRALVQQEAMSHGLPLIATRNAGGEDLIVEGETGFLVPIRSPDEIAVRIAQLASNRGLLERMSAAAQRKAAEYTWGAYAATINAALQP